MLTGLFRFLENWVSHDMAFRLLADMRIALFRKLDQLAPAYLLRRRTGDLVLVEESLNIRSSGDGWVAIIGELFNETNAVLKRMFVAFALYDAKDNFLGWAEPIEGLSAGFSAYSIYWQQLWPNETIPFLIGNEDIPFAKVERWETHIVYEVDAYPEDFAVPTVATGATWGQIKQQIKKETREWPR